MLCSTLFIRLCMRLFCTQGELEEAIREVMAAKPFYLEVNDGQVRGVRQRVRKSGRHDQFARVALQSTRVTQALGSTPPCT